MTRFTLENMAGDDEHEFFAEDVETAIHLAEIKSEQTGFDTKVLNMKHLTSVSQAGDWLLFEWTDRRDMPNRVEMHYE